MNMILDQFTKPGFLWLLLLIPVMLFWYIRKNHYFQGDIVYPGFIGVAKHGKSYKTILRHFQHIIRLLSITLIILALARPRTVSSEKTVHSEVIDIILAIDISGSMLAEDLKPNRIEAAKEVASDFISKRSNDRIGLIAYSGVAFTQCPLTTDHFILKQMLSKLQNNMVADGTAIGDGLALAIERLRHSDAISKVVILLTDGINNMGFVDPMMAASMSFEFGIRIYTIGVGKKEDAPYPVMTPFGVHYDYINVEIDEPLLQTIAEITGGKYFRATDNRSLQDIYNEIDTFERTKIEINYYSDTNEHYIILLIFAALFYFAELVLKYRIVRVLT